MIGSEMEAPIGAASGGLTAAVPRRPMRPRLALAAAVVSIGLIGPETSSARLRDGDVLVLDFASARVLRVRPSTGAVTVVTPRPGQPPVLASGERAVDMAIAPDGRIHLRGELEGQIVAVDPATGAQSLRFASDGAANPSPLQVEPGSIAFDALGDFYAYGTDSRALSRYTLGPADVLIGPTPVATLSAAISSGRSLSVGSQGDASPPMLLFLAGDAAGLAGVDAQSGLAVGFAGVPATGLGRVWAVEAVQPCLSVFCSAIFIEQIGVEPPLQCLSVAIRRAALINGVSGSTTLYEGVDPDDCALALAGAPIEPPMLVPPVIYIATGRPLSRPSARIERIVDTEGGWVRAPVATITPGAGSDFAIPIRMAVWTLPEPGSAMAGWAALLALGALGRRRAGQRARRLRRGGARRERRAPVRPRRLRPGPLRLALALAVAATTQPVASAEASAVSLRRGDVLVADARGKRVLRVRPSTGAIDVVSPRPPLPNMLDWPNRIAIGPDGTIFVGDAGVQRIVAIDPETGIQRYLTRLNFGAQTQEPIPFVDLRAIAADGLGRLYVFDDDEQAIARLSPSQLGWFRAVVWMPTGGSSGVTVTRLAPQLDADGSAVALYGVHSAGSRVGILESGGSGTRVNLFGAPSEEGASVADVSVAGRCASEACTVAFAETVPGPFFSCDASSVFTMELTPPDPNAPPVIGEPVPSYALAFDGFPADGACASAVATTRLDEVYVSFSTATGSFPRLERVSMTGGVASREVVSNLSTGPTSQPGGPFGLAIWTLPEPGAAAGAGVAIAALAALAALRRGARRAGRGGPSRSC